MPAARRQGGALQAAAGRGHPPLGAQAGIRAAGRPRPRAHAPGGRPRPTTGAPCARNTWTPQVPCEWVDATTPATRSTPAAPPASPRACSATPAATPWRWPQSMKHIYCGNPGETYFSTSDIGWVVGHSYIIYGPLIAGMATIMYEGLPIRPTRHLVEPGREVQGHRDVQRAHRHPRAQEAGPGAALQVRPVVAARAVPGRRAAGRAHRAVDRAGLGKPIIDNYWQTETGWPILSICKGVEMRQQVRLAGQAGVRLRRQAARRDHRRGTDRRQPEGRGRIEGPLPPGCMQTVWRDDERFVSTYWKQFPASRSTAPSTGASATRTATTSSSAAPTT
jgi:propionyl-CoA synthetase